MRPSHRESNAERHGGDDQRRQQERHAAGTNSSDKIAGLGGNDIIYGLGGHDTIDGGLGVDTLDYSSWTESIRVNFSGYSTDKTGSGTVDEYGSRGSLVSTDRFTGIEVIIATSGNDYVYARGCNDTIYGGAGDDWLSGADGIDRIYGGSGNDLLDAGNGSDLLDGGQGRDTIFWASGSFAAYVDLQVGTVTYYLGDPDALVSIENVRGADQDDRFYGTDSENSLIGGGGGDLLEDLGGDDNLIGDYGRDTGAGYSNPAGHDDVIRGGDGNNLISGDLGSDLLTGGSGADTFVLDTYYGTDRITDFEDGIDTLALHGGLTITGWKMRDTNNDGVADALAALISNGQAVIFDGYQPPPRPLSRTARWRCMTRALRCPTRQPGPLKPAQASLEFDPHTRERSYAKILNDNKRPQGHAWQ